MGILAIGKKAARRIKEFDRRKVMQFLLTQISARIESLSCCEYDDHSIKKLSQMLPPSLTVTFLGLAVRMKVVYGYLPS